MPAQLDRQTPTWLAFTAHIVQCPAGSRSGAIIGTYNVRHNRETGEWFVLDGIGRRLDPCSPLAIQIIATCRQTN